MNAILRNYGGRPDEVDGIVAAFFQNLSMSAEGVPRDSIISLIGQNIASQEARHLMLYMLTFSNTIHSTVY